VKDETERKKAVEEAAKGQLQAYGFIPEGEEIEDEDPDQWDEESEDEEKDELDLMKEVVIGTRRSTRKRTERRDIGSYCIDSSALIFTTTDNDD